MSFSLKKGKFLDVFKSMNPENMKYQGSLILRMYGLLNDLQFRNENRYILCNFIDQYSETFDLKEDVYNINQDVSLNQLFLYTFNKAKSKNLLGNLFREYINCVHAISNKIDITTI